MSTTTLSPAALAPDNYSHREREWTAPSLPEESTLIFDEPGRVLNNVCYRSHYLRVFKPVLGEYFGQYMLIVKHGGGVESWPMGHTKQVIDALGILDSDSRYLLLYTLMRAHQESERRTVEKQNVFWRQAAAEKRIKTRKVKGGVKVWIEEKACIPAVAA